MKSSWASTHHITELLADTSIERRTPVGSDCRKSPTIQGATIVSSRRNKTADSPQKTPICTALTSLIFGRKFSLTRPSLTRQYTSDHNHHIGLAINTQSPVENGRGPTAQDPTKPPKNAPIKLRKNNSNDECVTSVGRRIDR